MQGWDMENLKEKSEYLYCEPIKGDIYRRKVDYVTNEFIIAEGFAIPNKIYPDGSYHLGKVCFFPDSMKWRDKYQDSLSLRVLQSKVSVFFVMPVKRGRVNTRAFVVDSAGMAYYTFVPTFPAPRLGEHFVKLRMDLEVVSSSVDKEILDKVKEARRLDSSL